MKEERMKILQMLEEGKITPESAVKLLKALGSETSSNKDDGKECYFKFVFSNKKFFDDLDKFCKRFAKEVVCNL